MSRGINADESFLNYATNNNASLKTTIPMFIVRQFKLNKGDKLKWAISVDKDGDILLVRPIHIKIKDGMHK